MRGTAKAVLGALALLICTDSGAAVYVLGSSFSKDALPYALDDQPQWHIDCGRPLQYIYLNPLAPCEFTSTIWPIALTTTQYAYISFQPVAGTGITEQSDLDAIGYWMSLQPGAVVVIHPTWPGPDIWESTFHDPNPDNNLTNYSQRYHYDLIAKLRSAHPGRTVVSDRANEMLDSIYHDLQNGFGPLNAFQQMFADSSGHSSVNYGKYLQHNALRQAFAQQTGIDNTDTGVDPIFRSYLDGKVRNCQPRFTIPPAGDPCFTTSLAVKDAFTITENVAANLVDVLANDIGAGNPVAVTIAAPPSHGTASPTPTGPGDPAVIRVNYVPTHGYIGSDSFIYEVENGTAVAYAVVQMTILPDLNGDDDGDGVPYRFDNCAFIYNPDQRDTDGDGYGNLCDADFDNNGLVNVNDFNRMKARLNITPVVDVNIDLDGNGAVNINDLNRLKTLLGKPPGPSGLHP